METRPEPAGSVPEFRRLRLRYPGTCVLCGSRLEKGREALYHPPSGTVRCVACPTAGVDDAGPSAAAGAAGVSARREDERRATPGGAGGEEELAAALAELPAVRVLHDRRVPGTQGTIDHLLIAPAGVFVVDANRYAGRVRVRGRGGLFRAEPRLYVGRRDCSALAENMGWQVAAVERVLTTAVLDATPPITPVLCFVKGEWPLIKPPESFRAVRLEGNRSIRTLLTSTELLDGAAIEQLARILAGAFPAK